MNLRHSTCLKLSGCIRAAIKTTEPDIAIKGANPLVANPKIGPASNRKYNPLRPIFSDALAKIKLSQLNFFQDGIHPSD